MRAHLSERWSLMSLNSVDFKMHTPQLLAAIWPELGHEILNGSLSSWIIHMPRSPMKLGNLFNWGVLFPSQQGRCLQPSSLCLSAFGLRHYIHLQLSSSSCVAHIHAPSLRQTVSLFLIWVTIFTNLPTPVCTAASVSVMKDALMEHI